MQQTRPCRCMPSCKDLKVIGEGNEFWVKYNYLENTHNSHITCNACGSAFYLDGESLTGGVWGIGYGPSEDDPKEGCHYCTGNEAAMRDLELWRNANRPLEAGAKPKLKMGKHIADDGTVTLCYRWRLPNGMLHCDDGPARYDTDEGGNVLMEVYFQHDKCHRIDGPAMIVYNEDGSILTQDWYLHGGALSESEWKTALTIRSEKVQ